MSLTDYHVDSMPDNPEGFYSTIEKVSIRGLVFFQMVIKPVTRWYHRGHTNIFNFKKLSKRKKLEQF